MNDLTPIKVTIGEVDTQTVSMPQAQSYSATVGDTDSQTVTRETLYAKVNRGLGYIYGGIVYIIRNTLFYNRLKTKSGATLRTKSGAAIITSRTIQ